MFIENQTCSVSKTTIDFSSEISEKSTILTEAFTSDSSFLPPSQTTTNFDALVSDARQKQIVFPPQRL